MKADRQAPIGVFDSGVGGLTVVREIMRNLPDERIVYFGDTARVPYGNKSKDTILRYSRQIIRFLRTREVKAIVIACNTASAYALDTVAAESDIPIIGVINAGARTAVQAPETEDRRDWHRGNHWQRDLYQSDEAAEAGYSGDGKALSAVCSPGGGGTSP